MIEENILKVKKLMQSINYNEEIDNKNNIIISIDEQIGRIKYFINDAQLLKINSDSLKYLVRILINV